MSIKSIVCQSLCALSLCLGGAAHAADAPTYVVGAGGTYRPFEFENAKKELVGFDIDLIKAIAQASGFKVKLVSTPWEGIFATLNNGDRDIIVSGITITDKRAQMVDFSLPYFPAEQVIIVSPSTKVAGLADLKPLKVGVIGLGRSGYDIHIKRMRGDDRFQISTDSGQSLVAWPGSGPMATSSPAVLQSDHDPGYSVGSGSPARTMAKAL